MHLLAQTDNYRYYLLLIGSDIVGES